MSEQHQDSSVSNNINSPTDSSQPMVYEIKVEGHLSSQWKDWFDSVTITLQEDGKTLLACPVADQAALHGLLKKVRDLGMPLVSVTRVEPAQSDVNSQNSSISLENERGA